MPDSGKIGGMSPADPSPDRLQPRPAQGYAGDVTPDDFPLTDAPD